MTLTAQVNNAGASPVTVTAFRTAYLTFVNPTARAPESGEYQMTVDPTSTVAPAQTTTFTLTLPGSVLLTEEIVPVGKAEMVVAGVVELNDAVGTRNMATVLS